MKTSIDNILMEPYPRDHTLDVFDQVADAIRFMTFPIPKNHIDNDNAHEDDMEPTPIRKYEFWNILRQTYQKEIDLFKYVEVLFSGLEKHRRKEIKKSMNSRKSEGRSYAFSTLTGLFYDPEQIVPYCHPQQLGITNAENKSAFQVQLTLAMIREARERLMLDMIEQNSSDMLRARNITFDIAMDESLRYEEHFPEPDGESKLPNSYTRFAFASLTAHIGYRLHPQVRKWEELYALSSYHPHSCTLPKGVIEDLIKAGFWQFDRSAEEIAQDLQCQRLISKSYSSHMKIKSLEDELEGSQVESIKQQKLIAKHKRTIKRLEKPKRIKKKKVDVNELIKRKVAETKSKLEKTRKDLVSTEYERDRYKRLYESSDNRVLTLEDELQNIVIPKQKIINLDTPRIIVLHHPWLLKRISKSVIPYERITEKLSLGLSQIEPVVKKPFGWYPDLKTTFPKFDDFLVMKYHDWRAAFMYNDGAIEAMVDGTRLKIPPQRAAILLDIVDHGLYDRKQS